jgi:formylglycine-generating enzyme
MPLARVILLATVCALCSLGGQTNDSRTNIPAGMIQIPAGIYEPAFRQTNEPATVSINSFLIEIRPVTNADFLEFVHANPQWRRSQVKRLFAGEEYLSHWKDDLELGDAINPNAPVTRVSWFAARAYARWKGRRLPTVAEWEYVASASATAPNAKSDPRYRYELQKIYSTPMPESLPPVGETPPNFYGVQDLHGLVWEWASDFSTAMVTGDARGDTGLDRQLFCGSGAQGAKDISDFPAFLRFAFRSSLKAAYTVPNLGFRCAQDL